MRMRQPQRQHWMMRQPQRQHRMPSQGMMLVVPAVVGVAAGAVAEYLLDPAGGRARRARLRDQSAAAVRRPVRQLQHTTEQKATYLRGRASGVAHRMAGRTEPVPDDRALVDKVRSEVFGEPRFREHRVNIDAVDGVVTLRGQLDERATIRDLVAAVEAVPGVRRVENLLHTPHTAAPNVQGLQQPGE
jgi:hypothetical protein